MKQRRLQLYCELLQPRKHWSAIALGTNETVEVSIKSLLRHIADAYRRLFIFPDIFALIVQKWEVFVALQNLQYFLTDWLSKTIYLVLHYVV